MPLNINTNIPTLIAQRNLSKTSNLLANAASRLSSGLQIRNDAASVAMPSQQQSSMQSVSAAYGAVLSKTNMATLMEGALSSTADMLQLLVGLAQQVSYETLSADHKQSIGQEFSKVKASIGSISTNASFNGIKLLDSSGTTPGIETYSDPSLAAAQGGTAEIDLSKTTLHSSTKAEDGILTRSYGDYHLLSSGDTPASSKEMEITAETTTDEAVAMLSALKSMIGGVSSARAEVGTFQSELNYDIQSLGLKVEALSQSRNSIMDIDVATETANLSIAQIRQQASVSILSRTNENAVFLRGLLR
ncbi:flagellin [Rhizobium sp. LjRoot30]|uniref:flagellin N-terminal helical domain-containing protein n=1 Tax=Rhizobium sp. LjRoot30 TaxID=3342320 RepID=UPI003ED06E89